jgi:phage protein D
MPSREAPIFVVRISRNKLPFEDLPANIRITSFVFEDNEGKADKLTLTIDNSDLSQVDNPIFERGNVVEVRWGYPGNLCPAREMVLQQPKGLETITVEGLDASTAFNRVPVTQTYTNTKISDIVRTVAKRCGYEGDFADIEDSEAVWPAIHQTNQPDAGFMRKLAQQLGWQFWIDHTGLHFHPRRVNQKPTIKLAYRVAQTADEIVLSLTAEKEFPGRPGSVTVAGVDLKKQKAFSVTADNESTADRPVLSPGMDVFDKKTAKKALKDNVGVDVTLATKAPNEATAKEVAKGAFIAIQQSAIKLRITTPGNPALQAKTVIQLFTPSKRLTGRFYAREVKHTIGDTYITEALISTEGPGSAAVGAKSTGKPNTQDAPSSPNNGGNDDVSKTTGKKTTAPK